MFTVWLLVVGFLMQPILAYLVTPVLASDVNGVQVVVCTLHGERIVTLDAPELLEQGGVDHCLAMKLYQTAGSAQLSSPPTPPALSLYLVGSLDQTTHRSHRELHFSAYPARAPPAVS